MSENALSDADRDLIAFWRARLVEDEMHAEKDLWAVARSTAQGDWDARYGYNLPQSYIAAPRESKTYIGELTSHRASPPLADGEDDLHAADVLLAVRMVRAAQPRARRTLRELDAKRKILDLYEAAVEHDDASLGVATLRMVARSFAAAYSDHPDYDRAWTLNAK